MLERGSGPQIVFVDGLGLVEVVGRGPAELVTVKVQATGHRHHVDESELRPLDSVGAKTARLHAMKAAQHRQGKSNGSA